MPEENRPDAEILLVQADRGDADLMRAAIQELGVPWRLTVLRTGEEALRFCRERVGADHADRPDLVLLDPDLPDRPGLELLEIMKGDEAMRRVPIIVLSAQRERQQISRAYHLGANSFIFKPNDLASYIRLIQGVEEFWLTVVMLPKD